MASQGGQNSLLQEAISKNIIKIYNNNSNMNSSYITCKVFNKILLIENRFYTVRPACDVIKINLIIKQDG